MRSFKDYFLRPQYVFDSLLFHLLNLTGRIWPDKTYIKFKYWCRNGEWLDLDNPQSFNEKLNWLKLYYHDPISHKLVDKYEVKQIVADRIGKGYVVPCYGVWNSFDEIEWNELPKSFYLKGTLTHRYLCTDKESLNYEAARKELEKGAHWHDYYFSREWGYKGVRQRIIAEELLDDNSGHEIQDYKFWCFNGEPKVMYITNKGKNVTENFYDMDFNILDIDHGFPRRIPEFAKPEKFEEMKTLAEKLSEGFPFVRIDFFFVGGKIYFGEYTFYDWAGMQPFSQNGWDKKLGSWIALPHKLL